jgi:hypothetical protein
LEMEEEAGTHGCEEARRARRRSGARPAMVVLGRSKESRVGAAGRGLGRREEERMGESEEKKWRAAERKPGDGEAARREVAAGRTADR